MLYKYTMIKQLQHENSAWSVQEETHQYRPDEVDQVSAMKWQTHIKYRFHVNVIVRFSVFSRGGPFLCSRYRTYKWSYDRSHHEDSTDHMTGQVPSILKESGFHFDCFSGTGL